MEGENIVAYGRLPSPAHHTMTSILNLFIGIIRDKETRTKLTLLISEQLERRSETSFELIFMKYFPFHVFQS